MISIRINMSVVGSQSGSGDRVIPGLAEQRAGQYPATSTDREENAMTPEQEMLGGVKIAAVAGLVIALIATGLALALGAGV